MHMLEKLFQNVIPAPQKKGPLFQNISIHVEQTLPFRIVHMWIPASISNEFVIKCYCGNLALYVYPRTFFLK